MTPVAKVIVLFRGRLAEKPRDFLDFDRKSTKFVRIWSQIRADFEPPDPSIFVHDILRANKFLHLIICLSCGLKKLEMRNKHYRMQCFRRKVF